MLNKYSVQYLTVGGAAVGLHGYVRMSMNNDGIISDKLDLEFWYNPTYENYFRLLNACQELGLEVSKFKKAKSPNPRNSYFKFELEKFSLHLLPEILGLTTFSNSFKNCDIVFLNDIEIPVVNIKDLIKSKEKIGRKKDLIDIVNLNRNS